MGVFGVVRVLGFGVYIVGGREVGNFGFREVL